MSLKIYLENKDIQFSQIKKVADESKGTPSLFANIVMEWIDRDLSSLSQTEKQTVDRLTDWMSKNEKV